MERCVEYTPASLFDELEDLPERPISPTAHEAIQLGYAFLRMIPWVVAVLVLMLVLALVNRFLDAAL